MRAIRFKAKNINGGWVYGSFLSSEVAIIDEFGAKYYIEPETLCQFVGIADMDGVLIYEDDIVRTTKGSIGRVVYKELSWQVMWRDSPFYQPLHNCIGAISVIGNKND